MHSSNDMMISAPNCSWILIEVSGEKKSLSPFKWFLNVTPSSVIFLFSANEKTWNPPESVRIGPSQFINLCNPPAFSTMSAPGLIDKWYVLLKITPAPIWCNSSGDKVLTVAKVPTGINIGTSTSPWGVWRIPYLAPVFLSTCNISK